MITDGLRWCRAGIKDVRDRVIATRTRSAQPRCKEYSDQENKYSHSPTDDHSPISLLVRRLRHSLQSFPRPPGSCQAVLSRPSLPEIDSQARPRQKLEVNGRPREPRCILRSIGSFSRPLRLSSFIRASSGRAVGYAVGGQNAAVVIELTILSNPRRVEQSSGLAAFEDLRRIWMVLSLHNFSESLNRTPNLREVRRSPTALGIAGWRS